MKLDRLLNMTMLLINHKKITAQELAEHFNVSVRTIYRDVDTLSGAGIPVISYQGVNGGIALMEGYRIDKHFAKEEELTSISIALRSLLTVYQDTNAETVLRKLNIVSDGATGSKADYVFIDDSPWGQNPAIKQKRTLLKQAIEMNICVSMMYSNGDGQFIARTIEPHTLVQKGRAWYVYGFCLLRQAFRLFRLTRIKNLQLEKETFIRKEIDVSELPWDQTWYNQNMITLKLKFHSNIRMKIEEMFGVETIDESENTVTVQLPEDSWLYGFILSFADQVEVIEPKYLRAVIRERAQRITDLYKDN